MQEFSNDDLKFPVSSMICGNLREKSSLTTSCILKEQSTDLFPPNLPTKANHKLKKNNFALEEKPLKDSPSLERSRRVAG